MPWSLLEAREPLALRRMTVPTDPDEATAQLLRHEWLVTNGLGGYASSSVAGIPTRGYHGYLCAALPAPHGRHLMLNHLIEEVVLADGRTVPLGAHERAGEELEVPAARHLEEFRLEEGLPVWTYRAGGVRLEKRVVMAHHQNTVLVTYRVLDPPDGGDGLRLRLRPGVSFRSFGAPVSVPLDERYRLVAGTETVEVAGPPELPPLRLRLEADEPSLHVRPEHMSQVMYRVERARGYDEVGDLWTPGYFESRVGRGHDVTLIASTEPWEAIRALDAKTVHAAEHERRRALVAGAPAGLQSGVGAELVLAADQFIVQPASRLQDLARLGAMGGEARTVIAGYHWFCDWGRDTMISLEGLALATGRHEEACWVLRTFAQHVRDGLIPNLFPDGASEGLYHTADATPWFFQALHRYVRMTGDQETLRALLPTLVDILDHHRRGTRFGIGIDPADGLSRQGAEGYQLTWMDAKVGDWVVTPRRGKAVEVNALWYNAMRLAEDWLEEAGDPDEAARVRGEADRLRASFNERFWYEEGGHLYDVVDGEDGDDASCRPNQVFALSLTHPVLDEERWGPVLDAVQERLLTPVGLRSLDPAHPDYKPQYYGDLLARDAAYHQGTVWGWLIGPFVDAWLRVHGDEAGAARFLDGLVEHLGDACVGSMSEVFDAEPPYTARGCAAQAWSVAEVLRQWYRLRG